MNTLTNIDAIRKMSMGNSSKMILVTCDRTSTLVTNTGVIHRWNDRDTYCFHLLTVPNAPNNDRIKNEVNNLLQ